MTEVARIEPMIEQEVKSLGFALVRLCMIGGTSDPTLQIMAERPETGQLDIADCAAISRRVSEILDALETQGDDPIEGSYRLEVSSPGIDRPLTRLKDFSNWSGHEARVTLAEPRDGRRGYSGAIEGVDGDLVRILTKDGTLHALAFSDIASAKLVLTDKLINATAPLSTEGAELFEEEPSRPEDEMAEITDQEDKETR
ncbi:MAG: ribosome maturation protein RimP [Sphingomicrobium sp.]